MEIYRFVVRSRRASSDSPGLDPRSAGLLADAHALGLQAVETLECQDLYFIEGQLSTEDLHRIAVELLSDPITQTVKWGRFLLSAQRGEAGAVHNEAAQVVEVALRPGVTDPVADQIVRAAGVLGIAGVQRASTGQRYVVTLGRAGSGDPAEQRGGDPAEQTLHLLAKRLLANPVIQRYALGEIEPVFPQPAEASGLVENIPMQDLSAEQLMALSQQRRAALDLAEMEAIQAYYRMEGREPTDVEFETIAQTWSEHCVHKTFSALIDVQREDDLKKGFQINGLLKTYIRAATEQIAAPWVRSAFLDNAGIIAFDDQYEVSFKLETHNHPSAIEPFGGANTGVGGVIRDILGVSAKPIAATDILCFGPQNLPVNDAQAVLPEGVLHPRRIQSGVVAGVQDYGNKIGIPTVNGAILYDPGYTANPLVFCGCVGLAPVGSHPRQPQPGDRVISLGGRTGRDGLRGATFSSQAMDAQTGEVAGASVQIGDPITEKGLIEVLIQARDQKLYHAVTDCGAGGFSSAVGEMACQPTASQGGADVELAQVRLKYPGLAPWEIWLSEAQERMVLAVPAQNLAALQALCDVYAVELTDIGVFRRSGRLVVRYAGRVVLDLDNHFLHAGLPQRRLAAHIGRAADLAVPKESQPHTTLPNANAALLDLLSDPNVASKEAVIRIYDHEVQGGTVIKPLTGVMNDGPADGCVLKPIGTQGKRGIVLANGINPWYGRRDAYRMALSVIDEAVRNAVALGADPDRLALLDNFCWGDPLRPETLGSLVEAARGCYDAALHYGTPFISGKDSLNNEYFGADGLRHAIPPTLLISAIGLIEDVTQAVTMDLKEAGNRVYLLGEFHLGSAPGEGPAPGGVPGLPGQAPALYRALHQTMRAGRVRACHDLSEGGLAVAAAEMCIGGRLGMALNLVGKQQAQAPQTIIFGEVNGCLLAEVQPHNVADFENQLSGLPCQWIGTVTAEPLLAIRVEGQLVVSLPVEELVAAWKRLDQALG